MLREKHAPADASSLPLAPFASAGLTVPGGYVSTAPLVVDDHVLIRSSGTFDGTIPPMVRAYGEGGAVNWVIEGKSTIQPDMAELVIMPAGASTVERGQIEVIIAWSSGRFEPITDRLALWQANTSVQGWGLTANPVVVDEACSSPREAALNCVVRATAPCFTRPNASMAKSAVMVNGMAHVGDESGRLWTWTPGEPPSFIELDGAIRHAPLAINGGLLVHLQIQGSSPSSNGFHWRSAAFGAFTAHRLASGASPGMPLALNATTARWPTPAEFQVLRGPRTGGPPPVCRARQCKGHCGWTAGG